MTEANSTRQQPDAQARDSALNTVLIAEDDPIFRRILKGWLEKWKYRVIVTADGTRAWEEMQAKDAPQLAIFDWVMPGIDGVELCRRIRLQECTPYRYLLLLTAKDDKQDVVTGLEAGADDYLTKPFHVDELHARIRAGKRILELQDALLHARDALQFQAAHDPLTGLYNRAAILDALWRELQRGQRTSTPFGIMIADLDHFKRINDTHGHLVGDEVLRQIAGRFIASVRNYDFVGRYGGEEFLLILPGCNATDLVASAERLRRCVADAPIVTAAGGLTVTISLGLASLPHGKAQDCEALLRAADEALYRAKAEGRNRAATASVVMTSEPATS
jgi:diguanylate cyclase (GGDEF)-like protein